ncbi:MAG TPA: hypothetical protein PKG95_04615 [Anaerolineaceae bacterium]|nr:hypothetical protein [Anaerolineaceae bacterium]
MPLAARWEWPPLALVQSSRWDLVTMRLMGWGKYTRPWQLESYINGTVNRLWCVGEIHPAMAIRKSNPNKRIFADLVAFMLTSLNRLFPFRKTVRRSDPGIWGESALFTFQSTQLPDEQGDPEGADDQ